MRRIVEIILALVIGFTFGIIISNFDNSKNDIRVAELSAHGYYITALDGQTWISFDSRTSEYFFEDNHKEVIDDLRANGEYEKLSENVVKIISGGLKDYYVIVLDGSILLFKDTPEDTLRFNRHSYTVRGL